MHWAICVAAMLSFAFWTARNQDAEDSALNQTRSAPELNTVHVSLHRALGLGCDEDPPGGVGGGEDGPAGELRQDL